MPEIFVPSRGPEDWRRLLGRPERHWRPEHSAAQLAHAWERARDLPRPVRAVLETVEAFHGLQLLLAIPEHQVDLPPSGHPSQTDVWALARGAKSLVSLAVEGKVAESFGATIGDLRREGSDGQRSRLRSLCEMLGLADPPDTLRYQLLHRAASALLEAERFTARDAVLLVQSFGAGNAGFEDFRAFARLLGADPAVGHVVPTTRVVPAQLWLAWVHMGQLDPVFMYVPEPHQPAPVPLTPKFAEALAYASDAHWGQPRKGTRIPYVSHLLAVAALVLEDGGDETEAIAALLHDAGEDAGGDPRVRDIERRFGPDVAAIVKGCTDTTDTPKPPWRPRKEAYLAHLRVASPRVLRVSAADKLHNLTATARDYRAEGEALWARFNAARYDLLWYYDALTTVFEERGPHGLARELRRTFRDLAVAIAAGPHQSGSQS
jgi:5'-deoxynucleotidase YfbR-like HD superfamily hydrolase